MISERLEEILLKQFVVIHEDEHLIFCVGIYTDYVQAIGHAYGYASELLTNNDSDGKIGPMHLLNGEEGYAFKIYDETFEADVYILECQEGQGE